MTNPRRIVIHLSGQRLDLFEAEKCIRSYSVSTAKNGAGQGAGTERTPLGRHVIQSKIGTGCAENTVFVGRKPTGELYSPDLAQAEPDRDWVLTRVLWLSGTEEGFNLGGDTDTHSRFIYVHGCPDSEPMGIPLSHGCIRMHNADVIELYDLVEPGNQVHILS